MNKFRESFLHFKNLKSLTIVAMLIAISVILSMFYVNLGTIVKISFNFLGNVVIGFLFGPTVSIVAAGLVDFLTSIIRPLGPYNFFFTLTAMVAGLINGLLLFKCKITVKRIVFSRLVYTVICSLIINTLLLHFLYGNPIYTLLPPRLVKAVILLPIESFLTYIVLKKVNEIYKPK